jgi:peptide/nickel transport system substrate-binding protein
MTTRMNRRQVLAGTTVASLAAVLDMQAGVFAQGAAKTSINVRVDRDLDVLDPGYRTGPMDGNVIRAVFQRLVKQKANSAELENDAAAEVKQTSPTTIEFTLKPGQMFTDGYGEMTAEDVKFSIERIGLAPQGGRKESPYKGDWINLEKVEATGKLTGKITLSKPRANLFNIALADVSGCIVSKKAVEERGLDHNTKPVGSGAYQVTGLEKQKGCTLKRNAAYTGPKPAFEEIAVKFISDPKTTELALRSGELDFAVLPPAIAEPLKTVAGLTVSEQPSIAYLWIGMNVEKGPLADLKVRQAIRLGLDVDQMLLAGYNGKAPRLNTLLPPQIQGHWKDAPVYKRNVAEAKKLLAESGKTDVKLKITVLNQPVYQNMALVAQALLKEIGVTLEVDAQEGGTYWSAGKGDAGKNLDLFIMRFNGKHDPNFIMQWFVPGQIGTWNWQRWTSPEFETAYNAAATELDPAKRAALAVEAQKLMDQSAAFIWLTNEVNMLAHRNWLKPAGVPGWLDWQYENFGA